jgi:hypothetical protein
MRTIDEIVAETRKSTEAALREAYEAGRTDTATALKSRMAAFFEGLLTEAETAPAVAKAPEPEVKHEEAHQPDHGHDGAEHHG